MSCVSQKKMVNIYKMVNGTEKLEATAITNANSIRYCYYSTSIIIISIINV